MQSELPEAPVERDRLKINGPETFPNKMILEARFSTCYPDALDESCNLEFTTRIKYQIADRGALWWNSQSFDIFVSSILVQRLLEEFRGK